MSSKTNENIKSSYYNKSLVKTIVKYKTSEIIAKYAK